jgi:hypothetical protein
MIDGLCVVEDVHWKSPAKPSDQGRFTTKASREVGLEMRMWEPTEVAVAEISFQKGELPSSKGTPAQMARALRELLLVAAGEGAQQILVSDPGEWYSFSTLRGVGSPGERSISADLAESVHRVTSSVSLIKNPGLGVDL